MTLLWNWPIKSATRLILAYLIGQFQHKVEFYAEFFIWPGKIEHLKTQIQWWNSFRLWALLLCKLDKGHLNWEIIERPNKGRPWCNGLDSNLCKARAQILLSGQNWGSKNLARSISTINARVTLLLMTHAWLKINADWKGWSYFLHEKISYF